MSTVTVTENHPEGGTHVVGVGPVGVDTGGLGHAWRTSVEGALGPLHGTRAPVRVRIEAEPWGPRSVGERLAVGDEISLVRGAGSLDLVDLRSGARARLDGERVLLSSRTGDAAPCGRVLPFALAPALLAAEVVLVHAASIAAGRRAILVLGPTGAGKSTVAVAAREAGLSVLGDDLAAIWREGGGWRVQGLPRPMRVSPELATSAPALPDDPRGRVVAEGWVTGQTADLCGAAIVGHGTAGGHSAAPPIDVARAVFTGAFAPALASCAAPTLRSTAGVARLPGWELTLDADPERRLAAAAGALRTILEP